MPKKSMLDVIAEEYPEALKMDGYDDCILGVCHQYGRPAVIAYDRDKVIKKLMKDMSREEAEEWYEYNQIGSWLGENTPVFVSTKI